MRIVASLAPATVLAGLVALGACQPPPASRAAGPGGPAAPSTSDDVGSVSFQLTLANGFSFSAFTYEITGPGFQRTGTVNVANSTTLSAVVTNLPFGTGYIAQLTAQDDQHRLMSCSGMSAFDITSRTIIIVPVHMQCREVAPPKPAAVPMPRSATALLGLALLALGARVVRRRALGSLLVLALGVIAVPLTGCEGQVESEAPAPGGVSAALQIAPGTNLGTLGYQIDGPGSFMKMGMIDASMSSAIAATIAPLPPGMNYTITLSAMSTEGNSRCMGSAPFDVVSRQTTSVLVHLLCQQMSRNGTVGFRGALNICPTIDSLGASPSEVFVGGTIALSAAAHDTDHGPSPVAYHWTASGGTLSDASAQNPSFTCTAGGAVTLSLTASDGDATAGCPDVQSLTVTCTAP